jgi:trans-aconitate methyltransferase
MSAQSWSPDRYAKNARFVSDLGMPVVELLAPKPGERVLDLGCGDGLLTRRLADVGCEVVAIDSSAAQVDGAKALGLDARVGDGEALSFDNEFDAVFSNAVLHWLKRVDRLLPGVHRALRPKGRFVAECGGAGCVHTIRTACEGLEREGSRRRIARAMVFPYAWGLRDTA